MMLSTLMETLRGAKEAKQLSAAEAYRKLVKDMATNKGKIADAGQVLAILDADSKSLESLEADCERYAEMLALEAQVVDAFDIQDLKAVLRECNESDQAALAEHEAARLTFAAVGRANEAKRQEARQRHERYTQATKRLAQLREYWA